MTPTASSKYIELLKKSLIDYQNIGRKELHEVALLPQSWKTYTFSKLNLFLNKFNYGIYKQIPVDAHKRLNGYDWPANAKTMIGLNRLNHIESMMRDLLSNHIPGDIVETGVWRGGVIILMQALLEENKTKDRKIWAFDSFEGLPIPNTSKYPADKESSLHKIKLLKASLEDVQKNIKDYNLQIENIVFCKGWFKDTLAKNSIEKIALLHIDSDLYESTYLSLSHLYPKLSEGAYIIIDDYNAFPFCKEAVDLYRKENKINAPIENIDKEAIFWKKTSY